MIQLEDLKSPKAGKMITEDTTQCFNNKHHRRTILPALSQQGCNPEQIGSINILYYCADTVISVHVFYQNYFELD